MVDIIIKIPSSKIDEFKLGFLKAYPKTSDSVGDLAHIKTFIREQLTNYYKTGKVLIAQETTPPDIDEDVVEA